MVIYKKFKKHYLVALFFLIISTLLIFAWFKEGHFYGGGDVGLPTYNPIRIFQVARFIWWEAIAPGFLMPQAVTSITLYLFLSLFQFFGIGPLGIQAILFLILLFLMGFGMYLLTLSIIGKDKKLYATVAGAFYLFNPYMMTQIWHRFVHTSFLFVASIPFLILFWRLWIKSGNYLYLFYFLLTNLLASYMFGTIAFVFPLWLILFLFTLLEIFLPWENKSRLIKILWRFMLGLAFWILLNSWWLIPVLTISQGVASQQHSIWESIYTLKAISQQAILPYSLQMVNSFYLFNQVDLGSIYMSFFFRLIPWLGVITIFFGIVCSLRRKYLVQIALIYLVIIMLSKGTSSPFGQPFLLLFSKSFSFGLLRNPFEKVGVLLPVVSGILFVVGVEGFFSRFGKNLGTKLIIVVLLAIMGIYYFPMYQGKIFGKVDQPNFVEVPRSYSEADKWLRDKVQDSRINGKILHLPLTRSDIITYRWEYGYHGVESAASLFTALPSISHGVNLHRTDDALTALSLIFHKPFSLQYDKILKLLQDFNVRFIILHKDLVWLGGDTYNPLETEKLLNSLNFIKNEAQFGDLVIYKVKDEFFSPKIGLSNNISLVYPQKANIRLWPWILSKNNKSFLSPSGEISDENLKSQTDETIIFPENSFSYPEASASSFETTMEQLITQLNNKLGTMQYFKQADIILIETEGTVQNIVLASQKLTEIYQTPLATDEYSNLLNNILSNSDRNSEFYSDIAKTTLIDILKIHEKILSVIENKIEGSEKVKILGLNNKIKRFLAKEKSLPLYPYQDEATDTGQRQFYNFWLNADGKYELLFTNPQMKDAYVDKLGKVDFQINTERVTLPGREIDNIISFGKIDFKKGLNEISFSNPQGVNLIPTLDSLIKIGNVKIQDGAVVMSVSNNKPSVVESPILHTFGEDIFQISFDAVIPANTKLYIQVIQDMDTEKNGEKTPRISFLQHLAQSDWNGNYSIRLPSISLTNREARIGLIALMPQGVTGFNIVENVIIKNLKLTRVLNEQIVLRSEMEKENQGLTSGQIFEIKQKSPVLYKGKIKIENPTFLIFKEAFHPGWELELKRNNEVYKIKNHYLANLYGNAWWIERTGEYEFKIEFKPQSKVTLGLYLAFLGGVILISLIIFQKFQKK